MDPPEKRLRLGQAPYDNDDNDEDEANLDELSMSPDLFDARQDPLYELDKGRAKAATRLKSAFERIFEKYERDFTGVGDEIDLETGEVIVNNGHLLSLDDEKDRAREGSISSNEEERIMRGKGGKEGKGKKAQLAKGPQSKLLAQANSPAHTLSQGIHTKPNQLIPANGHDPQLSHFGAYQNSFASPNPYMFGPPMFNPGPVDPLWQTPDISLPFYQDRFGFIDQPMGYQYPLGYGPAFSLERNYGQGFLGNPFHHQASKKQPRLKTPGSKALLRAPPTTEDSEEDDILSGNNSREVKKTTTKTNKSTPLVSVGGKPALADHKDTKADSTAAVKQNSDAPQPQPRGRGRPRKVAVPAGPSGVGKGVVSKSNDSSENTQAAETVAASTTSSLHAPSSPPPALEEKSILTEEIAANVTQTGATTPTETEPADSLHRRSSRARKKTEFYGQISWPKTRQPGPGSADTLNISDNLPSRAPSSLYTGTSGASGCVPSDDSTQGKEKATQLAPSRKSKGVGNKEPPEPIAIAAPNQEHRDESVETREANSSYKVTESNLADLHPPGEGLRELGPLPPSEANIVEAGSPPADKNLPSHNEPDPSTSCSNEEPPVEEPQGSNQETHSYQADDQEAGFQNTTKGNDPVIDVEAATPDSLTIGVPDVLEEGQRFDTGSNNSLGEAQNLPTGVEPGDPTFQLCNQEQGDIQAPNPGTPAPELQPDCTGIQLDSPERVPDQPCSPEERGATPASTHAPVTSPQPQPQRKAPVETSQLPLRPSLLSDERSKAINPVEIPSPPQNRPPSPAKSVPKASAPITPKMRNKNIEIEVTASRSRSHHTTSKKKFALASLIPDDPDDEDELSILSSSVPSSPFLSQLGRLSTHTHRSPTFSSTPRTTGRRHGFLVGSGTPRHRLSKHTAPPATDSRTSRAPKRKFDGAFAVHSSPLGRTVVNIGAPADVFAATPSRWGRGGGGPAPSSPARTPGGSVRRCGEDGFVCDRDFCFTCCK